MSIFYVPSPNLQIDFSFKLARIRNVCLQDALTKTVGELKLATIDAELSEYAPETELKAVASQGLRGELIFPIPCILDKNPFLLGYYRLLLGFSQKEFYNRDHGISSFKTLEMKGTISSGNRRKLNELCNKMCKSCAELVQGIGLDRVSRPLIDDLTLLTLGPQLRGGANVKIGSDGIVDVFRVVHRIVEHAAINSNSNVIEIINASDRKVFVEFAPDPDIVIREELGNNDYRNIIAIEVKAGTDFSNIHNRVGEAEKSHQKAKQDGYYECWTVVNVDSIDLKMAKKESPSTTSFFKLSDLRAEKGPEYERFFRNIISLVGVKSKDSNSALS